jgi:hypothetical protein
MVTGRRPFEGVNKISTLSAILHKEPPPLAEVAPDMPAELDKIISRCLRKDPDRRAQHAGDIKLALAELSEDSGSRKLSRAPRTGGQAAATPEEQPALIRKLFGSAGARPYRVWQIHHIGIRLRCALLVYLAYRLRGGREWAAGGVVPRHGRQPQHLPLPRPAYRECRLPRRQRRPARTW